MFRQQIFTSHILHKHFKPSFYPINTSNWTNAIQFYAYMFNIWGSRDVHNRWDRIRLICCVKACSNVSVAWVCRRPPFDDHFNGLQYKSKGKLKFLAGGQRSTSIARYSEIGEHKERERNCKYKCEGYFEHRWVFLYKLYGDVYFNNFDYFNDYLSKLPLYIFIKLRTF